MALYIDRSELPEDISYIPDGVLQYVLDEHRARLGRLETLHNAYLGKNFPKMTEESDISVVVDYPRYIVDSINGMYLGDPVRYNTSEDHSITNGTKATVRAGEVMRAEHLQMPDVDISPVTDAYKRQSISDADSEIGKHLGEYGEAYELEYASDDDIPQPKTAVFSPRCSEMIRDTTVDHHRLFFMTYEKRKRTDHSLYYAVFVYTPSECIEYYSDGVENPLSFHEASRTPHFFGEVPAVEYRNNSDRLGDFETSLSMINAYNKLMSDRITDKSRFVDAVLFLYGMTLSDEQKADLKKYGIVDTLPPKVEGSSAEYIQKIMNENSNQILADGMVRDIHKMSMVVDMTDASFGTASGQALKMKLLTMSMLVKNKIRSMERGLKKRFELYNKWLSVQGTMPIIEKEDIDVVFSLQMPVDEAGIVDIVTKLKDFVDDELLLSLLWFVKDPAETVKKVQAQRKEKQAEYFDTFGMTAKENSIHSGVDDEEDTATGGDRRKQGVKGNTEKDTETL